jgi:hypothetical protein
MKYKQAFLMSPINNLDSSNMIWVDWLLDVTKSKAYVGLKIVDTRPKLQGDLFEIFKN